MKRVAIAIRGVVQGVGFRPFVYNLASRFALAGFVKNQAGSVLIEVEGTASAVDQFVTALPAEAPPLAKIEEITSRSIEPHGDSSFEIAVSETGPGETIFISPDVATCDACLAELFDPNDRRYRYPFLNCTNCGPRLTIITGAPYDRPQTTMAGFSMCAACRAEYDDSSDRRFHAQPVACPACGPRLQLHDADGQLLNVVDPLAEFARAIVAGKIGAMKGLGGYHLVCDARNVNAVAELRMRKHRDEKPFAVMVKDIAAADAECSILPAERELLTSPKRPIVLLEKRQGSGIVEAVASGNRLLGVMLPYTPLHHLMLNEFAVGPLIMTSGNRSDEPIAYEEGDAFTRLAGIADLFLVHNRPIHVRCDDSVTRVVASVELPFRRSRGYAPAPIALPRECPVPILAVGGQLKGTFALGRGRHAFLSHHLGDLDHYAAFQAFERDIELYEQLFDVRPEIIAHDLHPDYASTRYAIDRKITLVAVQHHHAHTASCMAENGVLEPVIGVTFDGTGYGTDGTIWGGEFLVGDYRGFRRAAHLRVVGLPGGDAAVREPWRMAISQLADAGCDLPATIQPSQSAVRTVRTMLERGINSPLTSSAGRLFDAVAAIAGVRPRVSYEGQAAIELEWLAAGVAADSSYPFDLAVKNDRLEIDTRPLIRAVCREVQMGIDKAIVARRFHTTVAEMIAAVCDRIRSETNLDAVVLSGGVFLNALLTIEASDRLTAAGFRVYRHRRVPPNDGGLSLGQIAVAASQIA